MNLYVALLHFPVKNRKGDTVATSVTNLDVHDISRACRTFGVKQYYLVHPNDTQLRMVQRILNHWTVGYGSTFNTDRSDAVQLVKLRLDLDQVCDEIATIEGEKPIIVATGANIEKPSIFVKELKKKIAIGRAVLLVFGTGSGLVEDFLQRADFVLEPIVGAGEYNHLSVRSAVSIYLDRLSQV